MQPGQLDQELLALEGFGRGADAEGEQRGELRGIGRGPVGGEQHLHCGLLLRLALGRRLQLGECPDVLRLRGEDLPVELEGSQLVEQPRLADDRQAEAQVEVEVSARESQPPGEDVGQLRPALLLLAEAIHPLQRLGVVGLQLEQPAERGHRPARCRGAVLLEPGRSGRGARRAPRGPRTPRAAGGSTSSSSGARPAAW